MVNPLLSIGFTESDDMMSFLYYYLYGNFVYRVLEERSARKKVKTLTMREYLAPYVLIQEQCDLKRPSSPSRPLPPSTVPAPGTKESTPPPPPPQTPLPIPRPSPLPAISIKRIPANLQKGEESFRLEPEDHQSSRGHLLGNMNYRGAAPTQGHAYKTT